MYIPIYTYIIYVYTFIYACIYISYVYTDIIYVYTGIYACIFISAAQLALSSSLPSWRRHLHILKSSRYRVVCGVHILGR